jgi:hypothetical protein
MDTNSQQDLFDIQLDETGISYIRKISRLVTTLLVLIMFISVSALLIEIFWLNIKLRAQFDDTIKSVRTYLISLLSITLTVMAPISYIYFIKFIRKANTSINTGDKSFFNQSFSYLYRNVLIGISAIIIRIVLDLFLWIDIIEYSQKTNFL